LTHLKKLHPDGSVFVAKHSGFESRRVVVKNYRKASHRSAQFSAEQWLTEVKAYFVLGYPVRALPHTLTPRGCNVC
jgi:hypothetical protein